MTLVEVVAGLALLGSLLVGLLLAKSGLARQRVEAERRMEAIQHADALLAQWRATGRATPRQASGRIGPDGRLTWQIRAVRAERIGDLLVDVVRLEIAADDDEGARGPRVLSGVDVMLPPATEGSKP